MPSSRCDNCGGDYLWEWDEAFNKFGFGDGDAQVMTDVVADVLRAAGYTVVDEKWGIHNTTIISIKEGDVELIPFHRISFGYDDPRTYLPRKIVRLLDEKLPENGEVNT